MAGVLGWRPDRSGDLFCLSILPVIPRPLSLVFVRRALVEGGRLASAARSTGAVYALLFVAGGVLVMGGLLVQGWSPFILAAAGAFMLLGPVFLAGFFGIAQGVEIRGRAELADVARGYAAASPALWPLSLVCGLLFMIFVTDAAILYAYMVGGDPVGGAALLPPSLPVTRFVVWAGVSGAVVATLLFAVAAFSVPLLCERRAGLVEAVVTSVRVVASHPGVAFLWAFLLSTVIIGSVLFLPVLPLTLPWLAFASRALYREVLPR